MVKRIMFAIGVLVLIVASLFAVQGTRTSATRQLMPTPESIDYVALEKLASARLDEVIHSGNTDILEFSRADDFQRAHIGVPVLAYGFQLELTAQEDYRERPFTELLQGGVLVGYPILVDEQPRNVIDVLYKNGKWGISGLGGHNIPLIAKLHQRLEARGITERVDLVAFGPSESVFGMLTRDGMTYLVLAEDSAGHFPTLSSTDDKLYAVAEILPLIHEAAVARVKQLEDDNRRFQEQLTQTPATKP